MPGIAGIVTKLPPEIAREKMRRMLGAMHHEDFYRSGIYYDSDTLTHIAWTCHKGSFADCMPVVNERRDVVLFVAGEMFPDSNDSERLKTRHAFRKGDATYLVHSYEEKGEAFFAGLNGWFSGFLIDRRQGACFLFNDRYGMGRLFWYDGPDGIYFASEAKALLAVIPSTREFDPTGLAELLTCGCTIGDRSLFKDIEILPGASLLEFRRGHLAGRARYFDVANWEAQPPLSEGEFTQSFTRLLSRVARDCASGAPRVGVSLTGGLDSRMVLSAIDPHTPAVSCYTFGSMYRDTYDVTVSRRLARECGLVHHTLRLGEDFLIRLPHYLERAVRVSDGYLGLAGAAELYVNTAARDIAPVRLTGNYGSEVLRGVRAFKAEKPRGDFLRPDFAALLNSVQTAFGESTLRQPISFAAFHQASHQAYGRSRIEQSQLVLRTPFLDNELLALLYRKPPTLDGFELAESVIRSCRPSLLAICTDLGYLGSEGRLVRAARRAYREALFKAEYLANYGMPDWLVRQPRLRRALRLNPIFLGRHKFSHFRPWLRERMEHQVRDVLLGDTRSDLSAYTSRTQIERMLNDHYSDRMNYTKEIDTLLTLGLTRKLFFGQPARAEDLRARMPAFSQLN